jgi:hypothetical protein
MSVSRLDLVKSETRDLGEYERLGIGLRLGDPTEWSMSNSWFFTAFVAIAAVLAILALILH